MTRDEQAELESIVDAAVARMQALGWIPTKTMVLAEVITDDGDREVCIAISRDLRAHDTLGLLHYAVTREVGGIAWGLRDG